MQESKVKFRWLFSLTFVIFGLLTWPAFTAETHVKDYLPVGQPDGVSDNTAGIQNAINAALGTGGPLIVDAAPHIYQATGLTITGGTLRIEGAGIYQSAIEQKSTTGTLLTVNSVQPVQLYDLSLLGNLTATAGAQIAFNGLGGMEQPYVTLQNVNLYGGYDGVDFNNNVFFTLSNSVVQGFNHVGVRVANTQNSDDGDSTIIGSVISMPRSTSGGPVGILQVSAGGLKVIGNKIVGGQVAYQWYPSLVSGSTGALIFTGNSVEIQNSVAIQMLRGVASSIFRRVVISGNEFEGPAIGSSYAATIALTDPNPGWLKDVTISGNVFEIDTDGGMAIQIEGASQFVVSGNTIRGIGPKAKGIKIGTAAASGLVTSNGVFGVLSPAVQNLSSSVTSTNNATGP